MTTTYTSTSINISQVNHLSHFLLTLELLPTILAAASSTGDCRIVFVSSLVHAWVNEWEPDNLNGEQWYGRTKFYPKSKLWNVSLRDP